MYPLLNSQQIQAQKRKEGIQNLTHPEIFSKHFCWAIVGTPGSGKTTFIEQLLNSDDCYKDRFEYIFVISPSPIAIKGVDSECITQSFKIDWVYEKINYLRTLDLSGNNVLIILDDCISQLKHAQNDKLVQDLFFNRRHILPNNTISIMITTQQYTMMPLKFRGVSDHFTFLSLCPRDLDFLKKELIYHQNRKIVTQIAEICQEPHQFIYVRLQPFLLCQNFKPLIRGAQFVSVSDEFSSVCQHKKQVFQKESQIQSEQPAQQLQNIQPNSFSAVTNKIFSFKNK